MTTAEDLFRRLIGKKYLSKIDLTKGYWQIPVTPEDVHKTAFVTPDGQYEFTMMPFGMVNSGATLVRGFRKILEGMPGVGSYIVIYSDSWENHLVTQTDTRRRVLYTCGLNRKYNEYSCLVMETSSFASFPKKKGKPCSV